jgi:hypothetical protein
MKAIFIALVLPLFAAAGPIQTTEPTNLPLFYKFQVRQQVWAVQADVRQGGFMALASHTDTALDRVVRLALSNAAASGDALWAAQRLAEWELRYQGWITRRLFTDDIGDHNPLSLWLANLYDHVEALLGVDLCRILHLSDIKTFNFCIPVVFRPCTFPMDAVTGSRELEWIRHFDEGAIYYGLFPVVLYWIADIACSVGTYGGGAMWLCGPIAGFAEWLTGTFSGGFGAFIFEQACPSVTSGLDHKP